MRRIAKGLFLLSALAVPAMAQSSADEVTPQVQRLYAEAQAAQQQGDGPTAIQKYQAMLRLAPHLAAAYNNLGMLYFNQRDYAQAANTLERGLKINPNMPTASALLGLSYFELGQDGKAEPLLERAARAKPDDDNVQMSLTHVLLNQGKSDEATRVLNEYLTRNPKDQQALYLLGKTYLQLSEETLGKIKEIDPNSYIAHEVAGEIDESMKNFDGALVEFKKAVDAAPQQPGTHLRLGNVYWVMGKWDSAETELRTELSIDPNDCTARWKLANSVLEANGSTDDALMDLNQSISRCPNLMQAHVDRARALIKLSRQNDALPDLLLAEKDSPGEPSIHFYLASVYKAQGRADEAKQELHVYGELQRTASQSVSERANEAVTLKSAAH